MEHKSDKESLGQIKNEPEDDLKYFDVHLNDGRIFPVLANDGESAVDAYYESLHSMIGHLHKLCECFGPKKPIDKSKVPLPLKVVDSQTKQVVRTLLYPERKDWGW